ncbi:MAG: tetratricopeptide repeat protein [Acidobacteria bacterium]|nr:tetratricopeptide repeat protein [Acidobacteriota bacterium]
MPTLSLAMIVKDEAKILGHCLASVRGLVDEMVVVDTGSRDGTPELARSHGARVGEFHWIDDFAAARNESLRLCSGEWVLVLDADETIDALDHPVIRRAIAEGTAPAFRVILRNYFQDGNQTTLDEAARRNDSPYSEGSAFPYFAEGRGLRLCRRMDGLAFQGAIHELLDPFFAVRGLPVENLDAVVHHFGKTFPEREAEKRQNYLRLAEREARARPGDHQCWFNLLQQAVVASEWTLVLEAARRYMEMEARVPILVPLGAGMALQAQGHHEEALGHFASILAEQPRHPATLTRAGISLAALGRTEEARERLLEAIAVQPSFIAPHVNLAELEGQLGRPEEARRALERGLAENPADPVLWHAMVQLASEGGDLIQAAALAWQAIRRCPSGGRGTWHRLVALSLYQSGRTKEGNALVDLGLRTFPGDPDLAAMRSKFGGG